MAALSVMVPRVALRLRGAAELWYFSCMRTAILCLTAVFCLAPLFAASGLDGKWSAEVQAGKKAKKSAGPATLTLMSEGGKITGTVGAGKRAATIQDGKLDGSNFSFVTV